MYTCKAIVFTFLAVFTLQFGFSNNIDTKAVTKDVLLVQAKSVADYTVDFRLINNNTAKVVIRLKDAAGKCIYFDKINNRSDYARRFILDALPDGEYFFSVENVTAADITKTFTLQAGAVTVAAPEEFYPLPSKTDGIRIETRPVAGYMLPLFCKNETKEKVTLRVRDLSGETVFTTKLRAGEECHKQMSLLDLPEGSYKIGIDGGKERILTVRAGKAFIEDNSPRA